MRRNGSHFWIVKHIQVHEPRLGHRLPCNVIAQFFACCQQLILVFVTSFHARLYSQSIHKRLSLFHLPPVTFSYFSSLWRVYSYLRLCNVCFLSFSGWWSRKMKRQTLFTDIWQNSIGILFRIVKGREREEKEDNVSPTGLSQVWHRERQRENIALSDLRKPSGRCLLSLLFPSPSPSASYYQCTGTLFQTNLQECYLERKNPRTRSERLQKQLPVISNLVYVCLLMTKPILHLECTNKKWENKQNNNKKKRYFKEKENIKVFEVFSLEVAWK